MKVYLMPGLGYDYRIFDKLDLVNYKVVKLEWIEPYAHEDLHEYALRLFKEINDLNEESVFIGHSLGGIIGQEIAGVLAFKKLIVISSLKSRKEMPLSLKLARPFMLEKLFTKEICIRTIKYWGPYHGFESKDDRNLFKDMVGNQTNTYLQWALRELSAWQGPKYKPKTKIVHIHGTKDRTLTYARINTVDFTIENGSHICVLKDAEEVSEILKKVIELEKMK